jgi:N-acetylglucosamine-6-sulfatase
MYLRDRQEYQLFDLDADPQELRSVHDDAAYAGTLEELKSRLDGMRRAYRAHSALLPTARNELEWWKARQEEKNRLARGHAYDLLFIGDSITQGWEGAGEDVWDQHYAPRNALNLGFSGDRTEHVLWRLNNGNLQGQQGAKVAVVMIGTNNTGHRQQDPYETAEGVEQILSTLRARCPDTRILLLGVFPRGRTPTDPGRLLNVSINNRLARFADGDRIHYLDISDVFLAPDGSLPEAIMPDALHPGTLGYQRWAEAMEPALSALGL